MMSETFSSLFAMPEITLIFTMNQTTELLILYQGGNMNSRVKGTGPRVISAASGIDGGDIYSLCLICELQRSR